MHAQAWSSAKAGERAIRPSFTIFLDVGFGEDHVWRAIYAVAAASFAGTIFSLAQSIGKVVKPMAVVKNEPGSWTVTACPSTFRTTPSMQALGFSITLTYSTGTKPEERPVFVSSVTKYSVGRAGPPLGPGARLAGAEARPGASSRGAGQPLGGSIVADFHDYDEVGSGVLRYTVKGPDGSSTMRRHAPGHYCAAFAMQGPGARTASRLSGRGGARLSAIPPKVIRSRTIRPPRRPRTGSIGSSWIPWPAPPEAASTRKIR